MKKNKVNNIYLILYIFSLTVVWFIYSMIFNSYNYLFSIPFSLFYIGLFLFLNIEKKFYIILFTLPFAAIFKITEGSPSIIVVLMFIYVAHILLTKTIKFKKIDFIILLLFILLQFLSLSLYGGNYFNLISFSLNIIFLKVCITYFGEIKKDSNLLINSTFLFSSSMALSIIIADIFSRIPYIIAEEKQAILMSINRFSGLNADPNYYSQLVLVAICLGIATLLTNKKNIATFFIIGMVCFLILNGFRSISKNYALSIGLILIMSAYYYNVVSNSVRVGIIRNSPLKMLRTSLTLLAGIGGLLLFIFKIIIPIFESRTDTDDILTGRGNIWFHYLELIVLKPEILISGVGFSNDSLVLGETLGIFMAPHNIYLEIIIGCGVLGTFLLLALFKSIFLNLKVKVKSPYFMYIVIILFTSFGLSLSSNDAFFILFPLIALVKKQ